MAKLELRDGCYAAGGGYCKKSTFKWVDDALRGNMAGYILSQARANNGGVLLMHDIQGSTRAGTYGGART